MSAASDIVLVDNRSSEYVITLPKSPTKLAEYAAGELRGTLTSVSGLELPVEKTGGEGFCITLRKAGAPPPVLPETALNGLGDDGFVIRRSGDSIVIAARAGRGLLYGVYSFLETGLGCRWYSSSVSKIPTLTTVRLRNVDDRQVPAFSWREVYYYDAYDPVFAGRLRLNGNTGSRGVTGKRHHINGESHPGWGAWCHSIYSFVPPSLYDAHPEYFSLNKGARADPRITENQVCFSNPDMIPMIAASLKERIDKPVTGLPIWAEEFSMPAYWSISQMDNNRYCECPKCAKLDAAHGSRIGSVLPVINALAKRFPDRKIATLAYAYTRTAPKNIRLEPNVAIQLCSIEPPRKAIERPVPTAPEHKSFRDDIVAWGKLSNDIVIWDYQVQFQDLVSPFPNFRSIQPNFKFYAAHRVRGVFCQGNREKGGEFAELRAYVLAKLLWNLDGDVNACVDDFLNGYYGAAAKPIREYFNLMHDELYRSNIPLSMDQGPAVHAKGYLKRALVMRYESLFDRAEASVKDDPATLTRVREARLPVWYARIQLRYGSPTELRAVYERFKSVAAETNLRMLSEVEWRKDQSGNLDMWGAKVEASL